MSQVTDTTMSHMTNRVEESIDAILEFKRPVLFVTPGVGRQLTTQFAVTGNGYTPNGEVRRFVQLPGRASQEISSVKADRSGQVSWRFTPSCAHPPGTSVVWAVDVETDGLSNEVTTSITANPACPDPPEISVSSMSGQQLTTTFTVSGRNFTPNGIVRRFVQLPGQQGRKITPVTANESGEIVWTFTPGCSHPVGEAVVWAVDKETDRQSNTIVEVITRNPTCP
jgi:hypothetical protein